MHPETRIETNGEAWPHAYCPDCAKEIVPKRIDAQTYLSSDENDEYNAPAHCASCNVVLKSSLSHAARITLLTIFIAHRVGNSP